MVATTLGFLTHEACFAHEMGEGHPESPERLRAISRYLDDCGLLADLCVAPVEALSGEKLARLWQQTHSPQLLARLDKVSPQAAYADIDPDTRMNPYSLSAARHATATVLNAVEGIAGGQFQAAFCATRPPGHHAEYDAAMGFCLINQAAVAVNYLREAHGVEAVAVLDFDVHHGNGTFDIFRHDESVLVCSSYQHPYYPGRQTMTRGPNLVHSPLEAGSNCDVLLRLIERDWLPALQKHRPEWIIFSAGFDAHRDDPLGGLNWSSTDYYHLTRLLLEITCPFSQGRVISILEGGYNLNALAESVAAHLCAILDVSP